MGRQKMYCLLLPHTHAHTHIPSKTLWWSSLESDSIDWFSSSGGSHLPPFPFRTHADIKKKKREKKKSSPIFSKLDHWKHCLHCLLPWPPLGCSLKNLIRWKNFEKRKKLTLAVIHRFELGSRVNLVQTVNSRSGHGGAGAGTAPWHAWYTKFLVFESAKPRRFVVASLCAPVCRVRKGSPLGLRPSALLLLLPLFARWRSALWDPLTQEPPHTLSLSLSLSSALRSQPTVHTSTAQHRTAQSSLPKAIF